MRVAMIATGYVGRVSGACFAHFGHVCCIDKDEGKIQRLGEGRGALEPLIIYNIMRQIEGNVQLVEANEATLLLPGDVLVVSQDVR